MILLSLVGCETKDVSTAGKTSDQAEAVDHRSDPIHYNFGGVIDQGKLISHTYRFVNDRDHRIRVLELVNLKTCCGRVEPRLRQGESNLGRSR